MYLTYDEYANLGGTDIPETAFQQFEFEARSVIDWWTFNRLSSEDSYPEAVKRCVFKLIQLIKLKQDALIVNPIDSEGNTVAGLASQSNDGVSASYNVLSTKDAVDVTDKDIETCIKLYLTGIKNSLGRKLLYRGVYPGE